MRATVSASVSVTVPSSALQIATESKPACPLINATRGRFAARGERGPFGGITENAGDDGEDPDQRKLITFRFVEYDGQAYGAWQDLKYRYSP